MTVKRPNKPASSATPDEVNRVTVISQSELADTAAYTQLGPRNITEVKIWLRVDLATDSGTLTIPDAMGGASATQSAGANKPVVGTTGNGLAKLTNALGTGLILPVSAGITNANYFGLCMWIRPTTTLAGTASDLFNMVTGAGTSANRISVRQPLNDVKTYVWNSGAGIRSGGTSRAILRQNVWKFIMYEFNADFSSSEILRSTFKDGGTTFAAPQVQTFTQEVATAAAMPATLISPVTGNSLLFNRVTATYINGFVGNIGPDIMFYDPRTMTDDKRVQLAQFRVPVG